MTPASPRIKRGRCFWALLLAALALVCTYAGPELPLQHAVYRYVFVLDITQSMNARDYHVDGMPADRLAFAKAAMQRTIAALPCGSEVGLGLFTTKDPFLLFEPLEVCRHFNVIDDVLQHIDWRMAWAAESHIARGLYASVREVRRLGAKTRLVFFSDGEQAPTISKPPPFLGKAGEVEGFIIGVGSGDPVPIPKLDAENRLLGYWRTDEVLVPAEPDTEARAAGHASGRGEQRTYHSRVNEADLKRLAAVTGLRYLKLETPERLSAVLQSGELAQQRRVETDVRWLFALAALLLLASTYLDKGLLGRGAGAPKRGINKG